MTLVGVFLLCCGGIVIGLALVCAGNDEDNIGLGVGLSMIYTGVGLVVGCVIVALVGIAGLE